MPSSSETIFEENPETALRLVVSQGGMDESGRRIAGNKVLRLLDDAMERRINERSELLEQRRWEMIEATLQSDHSYQLMSKYLGHLGTNLAEYAPKGYNETQVARDSDGS